MDIANYSSDSRVVIKNAKEVAATFRHPEIEVEHLLIAVIRHEGSEVESILNQLGKSPKMIESVTEDYLKEQASRSTSRESLSIGPAVQEVLTQALDEKGKLFDPLVEPEHIFIAIFDPKSKLSPYVREKIDLVKEDIYKAIADSKAVAEIATGKPSGEPGVAAAEPEKEVAGTLRYCVDLTNQAAAGEFDPMIGREKELQQLIQILLRRRKNSPVLVGGAGVGKSAIVEGFAQAVVNRTVPKVLGGVKVMQVDMGSLVAGAKYKGEFEERFKTLVGEVVKSGGKIILFIDEIHTIAAAGAGSGGMDAANLIKPALARGQIRLIGATTEEEYTKYLEKDKALDRRFERVKVEEPTVGEAVRIVTGVLSRYADHHKITYTTEAVSGAVKYARRYLSERNLPDVALDIIDEAGSEFSVKGEFGRSALPQLTDQIAQIEKLFQTCEGKDPDKDVEEFDKLRSAYDDFSRKINRLHEFWGHRMEAQAGTDK
jgi:ATP-dependent Clp protease ATP-binding subunit ClpB